MRAACCTLYAARAAPVAAPRDTRPRQPSVRKLHAACWSGMWMSHLAEELRLHMLAQPRKRRARRNRVHRIRTWEQIGPEYDSA